MSPVLKALLAAKAYMPEKNELGSCDNTQAILKEIMLVDEQIALLQTPLIGSFESKAQDIKVDGHDMVGVWTDGVMLSADNGKDPILPGSSFCDFKLESGKKYNVSVIEIK